MLDVLTRSLIRSPLRPALINVLLLGVIPILQACSTPPKTFQPDLFSTAASPYARNFNASTTEACEAAKRALLSQGYTSNSPTPETVDGTKGFQPSDATHVSVSFHIVCAPGESSGGTSVVYVNAVRDDYALKKSDTSASVGLSILGSVSLPIRSNNDSMVKISSETIPAGVFYERFFNLVDHYLKTVIRSRPVSDDTVVTELLPRLPASALVTAPAIAPSPTLNPATVMVPRSVLSAPAPVAPPASAPVPATPSIVALPLPEPAALPAPLPAPLTPPVTASSTAAASGTAPSAASATPAASSPAATPLSTAGSHATTVSAGSGASLSASSVPATAAAATVPSSGAAARAATPSASSASAAASTPAPVAPPKQAPTTLALPVFTSAPAAAHPSTPASVPAANGKSAPKASPASAVSGASAPS